MIEMTKLDCWRLIRLMEDAFLAGLSVDADVYFRLSIQYRKLQDEEERMRSSVADI